MTDEEIFLSIVVPAFNEERRIIPTLEKVTRFLESQPFRSEIVIADDGSTDRTQELVGNATRTAEDSKPAIRLLRLPHSGKGGAVKAGMLAARGRYRFFCDADLSMPIEQLPRFLPPQLDAADVAIASREAPGARRIGEPAYRHVMGRIFNMLIRVVAVPGLDDTQCGFKLFTAETAEWLFTRQTMNGFGFDVEILFLARRHGFRLVEVPIDWYFNAQSKVRPIQDTFDMVRDALKVRLNARQGRYES